MPLFITPIPVGAKRSLPRKCSRIPPTASTNPLIIGLNEYSHDTSIAVIDAATGALLFAQSKERISRRKHDGGDVAELVPHALSAIAPSLPLDQIARRVELVVANNHHFRIAPFERRLPFQAALGYVPPSHLSPWNLIGAALPFARPVAPRARKVELSHHLAHAYSAVYAAPFDRGLVVVMDGMGDALDDWLSAGAPLAPSGAASTLRDPHYYTEESVCPRADYFHEFPDDVRTRPGVSFREAESAYIFERSAGKLLFTRVFKRWTPENAPPELANHSFEEMDSVGALYSRVSAILFKDWNACGKVMGLAPYAKSVLGKPDGKRERYFMSGNLIDGTLDVNQGKLKGLEHVDKSIVDCVYNDVEPQLRRHFESLAYQIQADIEDVITSFITSLLALTGQENLVFAGGVGLNSTVNGILSSHKMVKNLYVPAFPGDEGISVGCALFGYCALSGRDFSSQSAAPFMPYLGKSYSENDVVSAIQCFDPWINWRSGDMSRETANALASSKVVAWFNGRSEFGPRALGSRSILADPRPESMRDHVNKVVKKREAFRPFAPSVLDEYADAWFEECNGASSPYMSLTKRAKDASSVPAVVHVDGTSRLQTLKRDDNPQYFEMISQFHQLTGIPMVMNTSFNTAGEPIVESPYDAIRCFLNAEGIDLLVFPGFVVKKNVLKSLFDADVVATACSSFRSEQVQDCHGSCLRTTVSCIRKHFVDESESDSGLVEDEVPLIDGLQLAILELVHDEEACPVSDIFEEMACSSNNYLEEAETDSPSRADVHDRILDLFHKRLIYKEA